MSKCRSITSKTLLYVVTMTLLVTTACTPNTQNQQSRSQIQSELNRQAQPISYRINFQVDDKVIDSPTPAKQDIGPGGLWIPLKDVAGTMDFTNEWNAARGTFRMGFTDVMHEVKINQRTAISANREIQLSSAPKIINNEPYIMIDALSELWNTPITWDINNNLVQITSPKDKDETDFTAYAMRNINEYQLITYARRFLGVPYKWGAAPYARSRRFDCSSYVKHVYDRFGIDLPRGARDQSRLGYRVSVNNLKRGDLMFFWVNRRVVGHVGIYAGNGKVIHTYGEGGVKYNSIESGWWRRHLLFSKRIAR